VSAGGPSTARVAGSLALIGAPRAPRAGLTGLAGLAGSRITGAAPVHSLPWYFGAIAFGIWAAAAVGFTILVRRRLKARAARRRDSRRPGRRTSASPPIRDDRSLGSSGDLERW
jgi:hypothetical protein